VQGAAGPHAGLHVLRRLKPVSPIKIIADGLAEALPGGGGLPGEDARRWAGQATQSMLDRRLRALELEVE
jgi:hypothetical protein